MTEDEKSTMTIEEACALLYDAGRTNRHEGAKYEDAEAHFETLCADCDPEYLEAVNMLELEYGAYGAISEFKLGLSKN